MMIYIPETLYKSTENEEKIREILDKVEDTSVVWEHKFTLSDAADEIEELGEKKVADWVRRWPG